MAEHWRELQAEDLVERKRLKPLTRNQEVYFKAVETSTITLCVGPAGTGKTHVACGIASQMLKDGRIDRIILSRPLVTCDEEMGFLPGDLGEKVSPYMAPMFDAFGEFFGPRELEKRFEDGTIEICPLAVMRGRTFKNSVLILDEAQNATKRQLKMFLTRFGLGTRVIVCGDVSQSDLPGEQSQNPLLWAVDKLWGNPDITTVFLTRDDVLRHGLINFVIERLGE